ncbi:MAG: bifunctional transaldolase/phosoglucose isomerase [Chloroflexota bacterium]|nr:bifunctional transaldolase/phosoglucose isomerase [Chloroflexota bacterium]
MMKLHELANLGQAIWLDYIRRSFITSEMQALVDQGVRGITSNPSIFEKAIAGSADYDEDLGLLVEAGKSVEEIYESLVLDDIRRAADILRPVYDQTGGGDGYVSLEVKPTLAYDTAGTIAEARRLFAALGRPNVMIKVPATPAGIPAIRTLISEGVNVNVTLIFSPAQYEAVAKAYVAGLKDLAAAGGYGNPSYGDVSKVASVASFFVSRVEGAVDRKLDELIHSGQHTPNLQSLKGKIAIANSKIAYTLFRDIFSGGSWEKLAAQGARVQRPLWASTSTKNPLYPDTLYVDGLIGPDTVNTVPPATLQAFLDHGAASLTLETGVDEARSQLASLAALGVDMDEVAQQLQVDGVAGFAKSFEALMDSIAEKREKLLDRWQFMTVSPSSYQNRVDAALAEMQQQQIMARLWAHDHTVWKPEPAEITNRLGWLNVAEAMLEDIPRLEKLVEAASADGYTHALLLGMGGSSLAPAVFRMTFGAGEKDHAGRPHLDLAVLDSTDPGAVLAHATRLDPAHTLFIVATKSGSTVETLSFFKFFYNRVIEAVGQDQAGAHFVAITDPGSRLVDIAQRQNFRATFLNDPNIGGRYSALSYFGLVPAALVGVDLETLLHRALTMVCNCNSCNCAIRGDNNGARLGAIMSELAQAGRDKLTLVSSPPIVSFGNWVEQLIAESTGKEGQGILPVVGEPLGPPEVYGDDRIFVYLQLEGDETYDVDLSILEAAGHPVVRLHLRDLYDLGGQFFLWEMATAVASHRLGINPFDQPNVEAAKVLARRMAAEYQEKGVLPSGDSAPLTSEALNEFLVQAQAGDYVTLQAYVQPTPETDVVLTALRAWLRDHTRLATTVGYGPRFLHSTGQLHKGDGGRGLFIQFTADDPRDAPIPDRAGSPDSTMTFGVLKTAQALGDRQALLDAGRRVIRFHLGTDVVGGLRRLMEALSRT